MNAPITSSRFSRRAVLKGGALTVGFALAGLPLRASVSGADRVLDSKEVDAYLAVNGDGTVTLFCGKVDLGQGLRIAMPQIAAEELGIGIDKIRFVEGDTALTPDQGRTSGSNGIQRGGMQIRQAAATARKALIDLAAQRLNAKPDDLVAANGEVRPKAGGAGLSFADLIGGRQFDLKLDPKAPRKDPATYTLVGKPLPRPDVPAKCTGKHVYMHDFSVPNMLHARVIRPPAIGATLVSVDKSSIKDIAGARTVRVKDLLAVVADDEWTVVRAARVLRAQWSEGSGLPAQADLAATLRADRNLTDETLVNKGTPAAQRPEGAKALAATYYWPMQSHGSIGPSCAIADVRADAATIWTASQGTHGNQNTFAQFLGLPTRESTADLSRRLRLLWHERSRRRRRRRRDPLSRGGAPGASAMDTRGRTRLGSERTAAIARHFRNGLCRRPHSRLAHRNVDSEDHQGHAQHSAAGAGGGRPRPRTRPQPGPDLAERRSALCGGKRPGDRALAQGHPAASGADTLARQAGQLLRGRKLRRRARRRSRRRPGRIPAARAEGSTRDRSHQARGRAVELADAALPGQRHQARALRAGAAFPSSTTSTAKRMWRWPWRSRSNAAAERSQSSALPARRIADRSSIPMACVARSKAASCRPSAGC